jgi:hypothetical protein
MMVLASDALSVNRPPVVTITGDMPALMPVSPQRVKYPHFGRNRFYGSLILH